MGSPEEKTRKRMRIRSKIAKDLEKTKYRQKIKEDHKKKFDKHMTHSQFVQLLQKTGEIDDSDT